MDKVKIVTSAPDVLSHATLRLIQRHIATWRIGFERISWYSHQPDFVGFGCGGLEKRRIIHREKSVAIHQQKTIVKLRSRQSERSRRAKGHWFTGVFNFHVPPGSVAEITLDLFG